MKIKTTVAALSLLSMVSFGAFAAQSISAQQASSMQSIGTITISGIDAKSNLFDPDQEGNFNQ
ncbi:hypothetical protein ACBQ19_21610, partial [Hafnia alvei]